MKISVISARLLVASAVLAVAGCKSFLDVNVSPNNATVVPPSVQLPTILVGSGFVIGNTIGRDADLLIQH